MKIRRDELQKRVAEVLPGAVELRHALHRIPEAGFEERQTAELLRQHLRAFPVEVLPPYLETDTVALLRGSGRRPGGEGRGPGRNVTLRADIDALPVAEDTGAAWASTRDGFAHACGHDGHMAILAGALEVLSGWSGRFPGSVRFVFQPAEEELGGGRALVEAGLLDAEPRPDAVFALHGWPGLPVGALASRPGAMMAAADRFTITVEGRGGHGAKPHLAVDPVVTAARVIEGLQTIASRSIDPLQPVVVSVCTVHGGNASNVIPDRVEMTGTTRFFDPALQPFIRSRMEEIARGTCQAAGAGYSFDYRPGYIPLVNDPRMVERARAAVEEHLGPGAWIADQPPSMGAEDFSYYLQKIPGAYLRLGLGESHPGIHSARFDFDDGAIAAGITFFCAVTLRILQESP
jgi:amidohydrolase